MSRTVAVFCAIAAVAIVGCDSSRDAAPRVVAAASNAYLEAAIHDVLGADVAVMTLASPGACPGHFDLRPSQMDELRGAKALFRFDFQNTIDSKLERLSRDGLRIVPVTLSSGMCVPQSYLEACRQVADGLTQAGLLTPEAAETRLTAIKQRIDACADDLRRQVADLHDAPVVASDHQRAFCEFLGLNVVSVFSGMDVARSREIDEAARQSGRSALVVANLPEGDELASRIASHIGAKVVVFGNFPDPRKHARFDDLVAENVRLLIEAAGS